MVLMRKCSTPAGPIGAGRPPVICVLSLSDILRDGRVRRQCDAFHAAGWQVFAVGLGQSGEPVGWTLLAPARPPVVPRQTGIARLLRRESTARSLLRVRLKPSYAPEFLWQVRPESRRVYREARQAAADVWVANDWPTLPVAARLAAESGGIYIYDSHELAVAEFSESGWWRFWQRPLASAVEDRFIRDASSISTVSPGIADCLQRRYGLPKCPLVIRNTPPYQPVGFRRTMSRIGVLYHGIIVPGRGLEACIDSVALWRPEFSLTIRGNGSGSYLAALRRRIQLRGVTDRVAIAPPVAATALVAEAASFDIGVFALPGHSLHNALALPNKFFEYVMAGLALCVSDLPEMTRLVRQYGLGQLITAAEPAAIARSINAFDPSAIDRCKRNALAAARTLCWERECGGLVDAVAALLAARPPGATQAIAR
jgi:glycosyltransferase involved in cell wall biosynthesis